MNRLIQKIKSFLFTPVPRTRDNIIHKHKTIGEILEEKRNKH